MKFLRDKLDEAAPLFEKGGKLEKLWPVFELQDTFLFTGGNVTRTGSHVRDSTDMKRLMVTVVLALLPCMFFACWNTGNQAMLAIAKGALPLDSWRMDLWQFLGLSFNFKSDFLCILFGSLYWIPIYATVMIAGGAAELIFAVVRRHEISEGFLVSGALLPLTLPPTIPLWMVALGILFGIVMGKEIFGGVGTNFLNPALTARAFLFFAYPAYMSGEAPWIAANFEGLDNFTGATLLAQAAETKGALEGMSWWSAFWGNIPGSLGETSALACLVGAGILVITGVGSYRTMLGVALGTFVMALILNLAGSATNPMFAVPWYWHMAIGSWAFGTAFMATDPVSSAFTSRGKWIYGFFIGVLVILIRVVNPAYPEGMMLAILFMNMFAPLIDHFVVQANVRRRIARSAI
ncbi:MAG: NADH:ubiquinone reductase (Na(+)-transporting) subunit B [Deltaproteobacteria bacterium]|nr:NADH:ubiquinone reductase (Na(+)-transporting) subunit B [Deltaproteobacteria bacterium]